MYIIKNDARIYYSCNNNCCKCMMSLLYKWGAFTDEGQLKGDRFIL